MIPLHSTEDLPAWTRRTLGYTFVDPALCHAALTHRSASAEHNERLEFLGDAVLNCAVARLLFEAHPTADEGALSRQRASLVSGDTLAQVAGELGLGDYLRLGSGELKSGGFRRASILADALEAILGAIFLDAGFDVVFGVVRRILGPRLSGLPSASELKDPKTRLQEALQARGLALPVYGLTGAVGEPHEQSFTVSCEVTALGLASEGEGASRRRAEQQAAERLLAQLPADMRKFP
ncbi:MAG: ribonuclease III [Steroidobacterales bacterium]